MSVFTEAELVYLKSQKLGRLATINAQGEPQVTPVGFSYNEELDTIDIGGYNNESSQKFRNVARNGLAAFVVDDVLPPWKVRGIEIRAQAEAVPDGGTSLAADMSPAIIRLKPKRIRFWDGSTEPTTSEKRDVE